MKSLPEGLPEYRGDFTPDECFGMLERAFAVYRATIPAPSQSENAWIRDSHLEDMFVGVIAEHGSTDAWILTGKATEPSEPPEIETISELGVVDDLTWLIDQHDAHESRKLRSIVSDLSYFSLSKALSGKIYNSGRTVWGITDQRNFPQREIETINARWLIDQAYELVGE